MATVILGLVLRRIFAVVFQHDQALLAISIALSGLVAGGVLSYRWPRNGAALFRRLGFLAGVNAAVVILVLLVVLRGEVHGLAAVCVSSAVPFVLSGLLLALATAETVQKVDRVYGYALLGAGGGCLLLVPLLNLTGGPSAALGSAALFAASSAVWFGLVGSARGRALGVAAALALVLFLIYSPRERLLEVVQAKGKDLGNEVFVRWNSFSRVSVTEDAHGNRVIVIDGEPAGAIAELGSDASSAAALVYRARGLGSCTSARAFPCFDTVGI